MQFDVGCRMQQGGPCPTIQQTQMKILGLQKSRKSLRTRALPEWWLALTVASFLFVMDALALNAICLSLLMAACQVGVELPLRV